MPPTAPPKVSVIFTAPADPGVAGAVARDASLAVEELPASGRDELLAAASRADVIVTRSFQVIDHEVLQAGVRSGHLRAVVQASAGLDNIDHEAARELGVRVVPVDPGNAVAVAELTLMSILVLHRGAPEHWRGTREGQWPARDRVEDPEVRDRRLGIVGIGRVGSRVARRAAAFEMKVHAFDPYVPAARFDAHQARRVDRLEELLELSDTLTLHCPLTAETAGMIGREALARLPDGAFVINTARGGIVNEGALREALDSGRVAGAALDVFASEPPGPGSLAVHPGVLPTPHIGGHTHQSHRYRAYNLLEALKTVVEEIGEQ